MSDTDSAAFFKFVKSRFSAAFSSAKTTFLTVTTTLFVMSIVLQPLLNATIVTSPVITIYLPVLTATVVVVAVVFARGGNLSVKSKGIEVLLEELKEKDLSKKETETWIEQPQRKKEDPDG
jgi:hypothetical protein